MKKYDSDDWNETIYFAEVKMIFRRKYYFCCPLEPRENGIVSCQKELNIRTCNNIRSSLMQFVWVMFFFFYQVTVMHAETKEWMT